MRLPPAPPPRTSASSRASLERCSSIENLMADLTFNAASTTSPMRPGDVIVVDDPPLSNNMPDLVRQCSARVARRTQSTPHIPRSASRVEPRVARVQRIEGMNTSQEAKRSMPLREDFTAQATSQPTRRSTGVSPPHMRRRLGVGREKPEKSPQDQPPLNFRNNPTSKQTEPQLWSREKLTNAPVPVTSQRTGSSSADILLRDIFTEEELVKFGFRSTADVTRPTYPHGGYRPRTCPTNGSYRGSNPLNDFIVSSINDIPPPYVPPPGYTLAYATGNTVTSSERAQPRDATLSRSQRSTRQSADRQLPPRTRAMTSAGSRSSRLSNESEKSGVFFTTTSPPEVHASTDLSRHESLKNLSRSRKSRNSGETAVFSGNYKPGKALLSSTFQFIL